LLQSVQGAIKNEMIDFQEDEDPKRDAFFKFNLSLRLKVRRNGRGSFELGTESFRNHHASLINWNPMGVIGTVVFWTPLFFFFSERAPRKHRNIKQKPK